MRLWLSAASELDSRELLKSDKKADSGNSVATWTSWRDGSLSPGQFDSGDVCGIGLEVIEAEWLDKLYQGVGFLLLGGSEESGLVVVELLSQLGVNGCEPWSSADACECRGYAD